MSQAIKPNLIMGTMRLGNWGANMNKNQLQTFINQCIALEVKTFDLADIYGDYSSESEFGAALDFSQNSSLRQQIQLISKCGIRRVCAARPAHRIKSYDLSQDHIIASAEQSLKDLRTDYLDMLLLHRPDFLMQPDEVAAAFAKLQKAGKVRHFGVSNFSVSQFELLQTAANLVTNQVEISILQRQAFEDGTLDCCLKNRIQPMAWSPFAGGQVFDNQSLNPSVQRIRSAAQAMLQKYEITLDQLLLAWLLRHPAGILPVLGTAKIDRVQAAVRALSIVLTRTEWYDLWQAATGETLP